MQNSADEDEEEEKGKNRFEILRNAYAISE